MSTQDPLNATQQTQDSQLEASDNPPKDLPSDSPTASLPSSLSDGFPPLPSERINVSGKDDAKKGNAKKRKGRKSKRKPRLAGKQAGKPSHVVIGSGHHAIDHLLATQPQAIEPQVGEEGVCPQGCDGIGLHPVTDKNMGQKGLSEHPEAHKNMDQKEEAVELEPIDGVEDVLKEGMEEVMTRAELYREQRGGWEAQGDVSVRVYARPLNPRLILVEWEGEDGVEKHGSLVVNERQRGMFGPGKVVWVRGPLVGSRWLLAGKYNFLGNRVS